ncbi:TonB-linked outer membrane protein, SusC/RagA family [Pedobacter sp. ok626]|uniref:SusC/RagA family TonB-linked outer membrane protein n=1 Tax=Pedobacter sp. ok626 TaxID=1761882 RepID=UPI0008915578|nr:TonB-dependent receptor [Pedobacter sp. ok626]SDJ76364.1 TonB-linked outer membrane protein, SusC/RagA family [Pedobacter sp. ok626]
MQQIFTKKKGWFFRGISLILLMCISMASLAQVRTVTGMVTDLKGDPLVGVVVQIKGTKTTTSTSSSGSFSIKVPDASQRLVFRYIGFEDKEIAVGASASLKVSLKESVSQLNDVVVIGYGTATRKDLTGSLGSVNIADLQKAPVKSFDEALAGRVAGVQVTSSEGQPGSPIEITIRGNNSITQMNYPLVVIDGFPMEDPNNSVVNPLNTLDPNEIESIDILKDASATAIYGARGANGVIMVTTKRGKLGAPVIAYNGYFGLQENNKRMKLLGPYEFVKLQNEIDPIRTKGLYFKDGRTLDSYQGLAGINWEDEVTRVAPMQNHYLAVTGGTAKTKYSVSLSHTGQDGIILNSGFKRTQGKISLDQEISDKLKVGFNATYSDIKTYGSPTSTGNFSNELNMLFSVWAFRPVAVNPDVNLIEVPNDPEVEQASNFTFNPILTAQNELRETYSTSFTTNGFLEYAILKDLKLKILGSFNRGLRRSDVFNGSMSRSAATGNYLVNGTQTYYNSTGWQNANTLTYSKRLNKAHYFDVMAGFTMESSQSRALGATAVLLPNESLGLSGLDEGNPLAIASTSSNSTLASFIGRLNYKLFDRYVFTATVREDGSSRFLNKNTWSNFPSLGVAWQINNESFAKNIKYLSNAKLRASWGRTGNNQVSNFAAYPSLNFANPDGSYPINNSPGYMFGGNDSKGVIYSGLGNADLRWETTEQSNIGLDLGFFKQRLTFEFDLYQKKTFDLLLNANLPPTTGYNRAIKNIGSTQNRGLEITIGFTPVQGRDFTWSSSFNIAFNRNKILGLTENQLQLTTSQSWGDDWKNIPGYVAKIGSPIAQFYGLIYDGVYNYDDFVKVGDTYTLKENIPSNGGSRANIKPGDVKYVDLNGDLQISEGDKTVIGTPYAKHTGGFSNNFTYKNFDLNVFFQWSYGNDIINANRILFESSYKYGYNQYATYADRWSPENPTSNIPGVAAGRGSSLKAYSTRTIEDGSFLRLKTVALGYNIPADFVRRSKVFKTGRVYLSAQNLYTWTKYSGYDPEVSVRNSALTPGFDYSAYPRARTITFGINTTF